MVIAQYNFELLPTDAIRHWPNLVVFFDYLGFSDDAF